MIIEKTLAYFHGWTERLEIRCAQKVTQLIIFCPEIGRHCNIPVVIKERMLVFCVDLDTPFLSQTASNLCFVAENIFCSV